MPLSVPGEEAVPLHGSILIAKDCATIKAVCNVHWSESKKIAVVQIGKAASMTLGKLFKNTFEDAEMRACAGLPKDAVVGAFLRDPVELFFSGYEEAINRISINQDKGREDKVPAMIFQDIKGYNDSRKYWEESKTATQTFHEYVLHGHNVAKPFDTHLIQQSSRVAQLKSIIWVGRVSDLTEDWARFLTFARAWRPNEVGGKKEASRVMGPNLARAAPVPLSVPGNEATPEEVPKWRERKWKHIVPTKTPAYVLKKICEHVDQDLRCLGLQSRWCSY